VHSTILVNEKGDQLTGPNNVEVVDPVTGMVLFKGNSGSVVGQLVKPDVPVKPRYCANGWQIVESSDLSARSLHRLRGNFFREKGESL
jgi:hypothetical protein